MMVDFGFHIQIGHGLGVIGDVGGVGQDGPKVLEVGDLPVVASGEDGLGLGDGREAGGGGAVLEELVFSLDVLGVPRAIAGADLNSLGVEVR